MSIENRKFVIEGAPGAGKTTLLFGNTDDPNNPDQIPSLSDHGFNIVREAITKIADDMRAEGKVPTENIKQFVQRTIDQSIEDSSNSNSDICILERGLPGYFFIENIFDEKLPQKYHDFCEATNYESPIFVLETIDDFDMSEANKSLRKGRVATLKQRKDIFNKTIELYRQLGYEIEIVPMYSKDITENNKKRIEHILKFISKE